MDKFRKILESNEEKEMAVILVMDMLPRVSITQRRNLRKKVEKDFELDLINVVSGELVYIFAQVYKGEERELLNLRDKIWHQIDKMRYLSGKVDKTRMFGWNITDDQQIHGFGWILRLEHTEIKMSNAELKKLGVI